MKEKLNKKDIKTIDYFLIKHDVKYIDARVELIDHLASEFEERSHYSLLEGFLLSKRKFIKDYCDKRQKTIHWSFQKQVLLGFLKFFYKPKDILLTITLIISIYISMLIFDNETSYSLCIGFLIVPNILAIFYNILHKAYNKTQAANSLFSIMAVPSLFLYLMPLIKSFLLENYYALFAYWLISLIFTMTGLIEFYKRRKEIVNTYNALLNVK